MTKVKSVAKDFDRLLNDKNVKYIAEYIVNSIGDLEEVFEQSLDYEFDLKGGQVIGKDIANTFYNFDTNDETVLNKIVSYMNLLTDKEVKDRIESFDRFRKDVGEYIENNLKIKLEEKIRKHILNNSSKELFPLRSINILDFELSDKPEIDYVIVVQKNAPPGVETPPVSQELIELSKTGRDFKDIIAEKKASGDPKYRYVSGAYKKKYWYEVRLNMYVDYSAKKKGQV